MAQTFHMPDLGEGLTEATIVAWYVKVGDTIVVDQVLVEIDTGKTVVEIPSPFAGTITTIMAGEGETVDVDAVLYVVDGDSSNPPKSVAETSTTQEVTMPSNDSVDPKVATGRLKAMPIVRKLAREIGVDLSTIAGTGPGGVITRDDVLESTAESDSRQRIELSQTRRAIAEHMTRSWTTIPHVTVQADIRSEALLARRSTRTEGKYPLEVLVGAAVLPLLDEFPEFNAEFSDGAMLHSSTVHLGFAVDTPAGLIVVVVRDANQMDVETLASEFERLSVAAQDRRVSIEEVSGQTFTVSNIGALGGGHGTPIIPLGTSAIMSIGRATEQPVIENGELTVGLVAPIDLSYDHRLIDGALGQRFLSALTTGLESIK